MRNEHYQSRVRRFWAEVQGGGLGRESWAEILGGGSGRESRIRLQDKTSEQNI